MIQSPFIANTPGHAELVSASMAAAGRNRDADGQGGSWTLKRVQGDDERKLYV